MQPKGLEVNNLELNTIAAQRWQSKIARYGARIKRFEAEISVFLVTISSSLIFLWQESLISSELAAAICGISCIFGLLKRKVFLIALCAGICFLSQLQQKQLADNYHAAVTWFEDHAEVVGRGSYMRIATIAFVERSLDTSQVHSRRIIVKLQPENCFVSQNLPCEFLLLLSVADLPWQDATAYLAEAQIKITAKVRLLAEPEHRVGYENYLYRRGIVAQGFLEAEPVLLSPGFSDAQDNLVQHLTKYFDRDEGMAILIAAVLGEHSLLGTELKDAFKNLGIMHLLVVSGFHIGLFYLIFRVVLRSIFSLSLSLTSYCNANSLAAVAALYFCFLYVEAIDAGLSSERALVMLLTYTVASLIQRRASRINVLLASFIVINLLWPSAIVDIGCQLTYAALIGLLIADCIVKSDASKELPQLWQKLFATYCYSYFAWLCTAPVLLYWFELVPLVGPLTNILVVSYFSFAVIGLGLVGILLSLLDINFAWHAAQVAASLLYLQMQALDSFLLTQPWAFFSTIANSGLPTWSTILLMTMPIIAVVFRLRLKLLLLFGSDAAILRQAKNPLTWSSEATKEANDFKKLFHRSR